MIANLSRYKGVCARRGGGWWRLYGGGSVGGGAVHGGGRQGCVEDGRGGALGMLDGGQ